MISTISVKANGTDHKLRFSARAMMKIERETGEGVMDFLKKMDGSLQLSAILKLFEACLNDGKGASEDEALDIMDDIGAIKAAEVIGKAVSEAFPKAEGEAEGEAAAPEKNEKGAD